MNLLRLVREQIKAHILQLAQSQPNLKYNQIADQVGCNRSTVLSEMKRAGVTRPRGVKPGVSLSGKKAER